MTDQGERIVVGPPVHRGERLVTLQCEHPEADLRCPSVTHHPRDWGWADALAGGWRARPWGVRDGVVVVLPPPPVASGAQQFPPYDWRRCCPRHAEDRPTPEPPRSRTPGAA